MGFCQFVPLLLPLGVMGPYQFILVFIILFIIPGLLISFRRKKKRQELPTVWNVVSWAALCIGMLLVFVIAEDVELVQSTGISLLAVVWIVTMVVFALIQLALPIKSKPTNIKKTSQKDELDSLVKYKELLDKGVITQEEFEIKKKEVLNIQE